MHSERTTYRLADLCELRAGSGFKLDLQGKQVGDYPFIKVSDMNLSGNETRIRVANNWISEADREKLRAKPFSSGTTVFAKIGEALKQNRLRLITRNTIIDNNMMGAIPDQGRVDPEYFYYALSKFDFGAISGGTALPYLTVSALNELQLVLPPRKEQRAIAHILGTLDDKIELNRRMNETLEAMARAIFQSWFVDFDPVRAKASGESPDSICQRLGLTPELLALFPDSFKDSELGAIPNGWNTESFSETITINPTRTLKKGVIAPYLDMANMPTASARAHEIVEREFGSGMKFQNGDTLVARITPCLENGKTCFVDFLNEEQIGWGSTEYIVLRPSPPLPPEYGYFLARTEKFRDHAIANMSGTSGRQRVPANAFNDVLLVIPGPDVASAFGVFAQATIESMRSRDVESQTLTAMRDSLVPKLLSGELSVTEAIAEVGA